MFLWAFFDFIFQGTFTTKHCPWVALNTELFAYTIVMVYSITWGIEWLMLVWHSSQSLPLFQRSLKIMQVPSTLDISKFWGLFFTSSYYPKCKLICTSGNLDLIQIDASNFAEFEISEFGIPRFDCIMPSAGKYINII